MSTLRYDWAVQEVDDNLTWSTHQDHVGRDHETALSPDELAEMIATRVAPPGRAYRAAVWPAGHHHGEQPIATAACTSAPQPAAA